jgi:hypothetical protein
MIYDCEMAEIIESVKIKRFIQDDWEFVCVAGKYVYFRKKPIVK